MIEGCTNVDYAHYKPLNNGSPKSFNVYIAIFQAIQKDKNFIESTTNSPIGKALYFPSGENGLTLEDIQLYLDTAMEKVKQTIRGLSLEKLIQLSTTDKVLTQSILRIEIGAVIQKHHQQSLYNKLMGDDERHNYYK